MASFRRGERHARHIPVPSPEYREPLPALRTQCGLRWDKERTLFPVLVFVLKSLQQAASCFIPCIINTVSQDADWCASFQIDCEVILAESSDNPSDDLSFKEGKKEHVLVLHQGEKRLVFDEIPFTRFQNRCKPESCHFFVNFDQRLQRC